MPQRRLRVAIVGGGPKGLFALERLLHHLRENGGELDIDLFEPHPVPGAGPVYDPRQPAYLRMNFAADGLDMWPPGSRAVPAAQQGSFVDWRDAAGLWPEDYPPRAQVGRYLADGLARLLRAAPPGVRVTLRAANVSGARRRGTTWTIATAHGCARDYDEILVAVGHQAERDRWPAGSWSHAAPLIGAVFPVTRFLARERVAPGATVAVRGFALTFIDAAIALTQGRGGAFESDAGHPYRLRYLPSADDACLILPFSRSGRPMLAKPDSRLAAGVPALPQIARAGSARIAALGDAFVFDELLEILARTVADSLVAATARWRAGLVAREAERAAARWLAAACTGIAPPCGLGPAAELERSLAVGARLRAPDLQWALGHGWRSLYPTLVARLSGDGLPERAWPAFHALAAQLERVAFGPPAINAAKLLALVDARRVDLCHAAGARIDTDGAATSIRSPGGAHAIDALVDAVLPGPGALDAGGLLAQLVADGYARVPGTRRGLEVTADASCIGRDGQRSPGLAAIGRPTEDSVIGNDTLTRALHPHAGDWARRVSRRAARRSADQSGDAERPLAAA